MRLDEIIAKLSWERGQIDKALAALEMLRETGQNGHVPGRPGRKAIGREERAEVSERMKRYWAKRRKSA